MRLVGSLVVQNEEHRFLKSFLEWNTPWMDELFVYDGGSTDNTVKICSQYTDTIYHHKPDTPSFLEHEGKYRSAAFAAMADVMKLREDDWVFSIDADEFLAGSVTVMNLRADLNVMIYAAGEMERDSVELPIPEVWDVSGPALMMRTDGYWATMKLPRLFRFKDNWHLKREGFRDKAMGCGSGPQYTYRNMMRTVNTARLLHFGYAFDEDKQAKSDRYLSLKNHGHNEKHIKSILEPPTLRQWTGMIPKWHRGPISE